MLKSTNNIKRNAEKYRLELILGPMTGGKTTELGRRMRVKSVYKRTLVVNTKKDVRFGDDGAITHDGHHIKAVRVDSLSDLLETDVYKEAEVVGIDEGQFFPEINEFIRFQLKKTTKTFIVAALSGDKDMQLFGNVYKLIPCASSIDVKRAVCKRCGDGTEASFTAALIPFSGQEKVGGTDIYEAVCREHYDEIQRENIKRSTGSMSNSSSEDTKNEYTKDKVVYGLLCFKCEKEKEKNPNHIPCDKCTEMYTFGSCPWSDFHGINISSSSEDTKNECIKYETINKFELCFDCNEKEIEKENNDSSQRCVECTKLNILLCIDCIKK